ncbi:MAG: TetR/AcrR family transcriptional regulator [Clostridiales bacterium]|nr:TetR/AcrR family transcriptional regulator [Clostridiales bacterium]
MYKNCQKEQSAQRQAHIARTFMNMLESRNFQEITVTDLCREAGIPRKAFYRYFDTKEDMIRFIADAIILAYLRMERESGQTDRLGESLCQKMFAFWYEYREHLRVLVRSECMGLFSESFTRGVLEIGPSFGDMSGWSEAERLPITVFTTAGFISLLIYWVHTDFRDTPEEMGRTLYRLLTQPIYV